MSRLAKCFGYYIPPTEQELLFAAGKEYDKGQVIIKEEALVAKMILYRSHLSTRTTGNTRNMIMLFLIQSILGLNTSIAYWEHWLESLV
jgi:hypothetical protein